MKGSKTPYNSGKQPHRRQAIMKCIVIQTSPERINAEPVTNEDSTPYVYATMAEARAELKANGYIYNRANQRYYINGTEYRAYILRADSEEYAEIMEQAEQQAAPEYIEPEHIQTVSGNKIYRSIDPVTGWNVFTVAGRDFWELAEARYFAQCNPAGEPEQETAYTARIAAALVVDAYAAAEAISPADVTPEQYAAAYAVAAADVIGTDKEATEEQRATVAAMVEAIADRWTQDHQPRDLFSEQAEYEQYAAEFAAAVQLMDDDIREELHAIMAPCSPAEFLAAYEAAHLAKYGAPFQYV